MDSYTENEIKKGQAASDLFGVANSCYLVSYAITFLVLQLCCNGKDTTIIECAKEKGRKFNP